MIQFPKVMTNVVIIGDSRESIKGNIRDKKITKSSDKTVVLEVRAKNHTEIDNNITRNQTILFTNR